MPGLEGTTLDHYQIQRRLGRGGMAEVYLAYDAETNQAVAEMRNPGIIWLCPMFPMAHYAISCKKDP